MNMAGKLRSIVGVALTSAAAASLFAGSAAASPLAKVAERADAPTTQLDPAQRVAVPGGGAIQHFDQTVGGLPVFGAEVVAVNPEGAPASLVSDSTVDGLQPKSTAGAISKGAAIAAARRSAGVKRLRDAASAALGVDPRTGRLAWQISLPSADPLADYEVTVDARNGSQLHRSPDLLRHATGTARIFNPNPVVEQGGYTGLKDRNDKDSALLDSLQTPVSLERITDLNGCLAGQYVDARVGKKGKKVCAPNYDFTAVNRSNDQFEALMAYFHIDRTRFYADSLGLSKPLRVKAQKVFADAIPDDNSFYSSMSHKLVLGTGGIDDGEDADVIIHEYGHSLQDQASPGSLRTRQGATMGEGFGDYMAAAMSNLETGGSPFDTCIFDWDGIPYSPTGTCGRRANVSFDVKKAEKKCRNEIHCVGEVWSSTLFELRTQLGNDANGQSVMDRDVLEANFMLTTKTNFKQGAKGIIKADQLLYGGAHVAQIQAVMTQRKFL